MDRLLCLNALRDWKGSAIFSGRVREGVPRRFESMKEDSLDYFQSERQLRPFIPVSLHLRGSDSLCSGYDSLCSGSVFRAKRSKGGETGKNHSRRDISRFPACMSFLSSQLNPRLRRRGKYAKSERGSRSGPPQAARRRTDRLSRMPECAKTLSRERSQSDSPHHAKVLLDSEPSSDSLRPHQCIPARFPAY